MPQTASAAALARKSEYPQKQLYVNLIIYDTVVLGQRESSKICAAVRLMELSQKLNFH